MPVQHYSSDDVAIARQFRAELARHRRRRRFIPTFESGALADGLRDLLETLNHPGLDPRLGVTLVVEFYRADARIFGLCDDSNGSVGDVFRIDASRWFATFAKRCDDPLWVSAAVFELVRDDDYGVRDSILRHSAEYLSPTALRVLADRLWQAGEAAKTAAAAGGDRWGWRHWFSLVEMTAQQLNDPRLFERARRTTDPELGTAACLDIAKAWARADEPSLALAWLERIRREEPFLKEERDRLLRELYPRLGREADLVALLWERFRARPSRLALDELVAVIGGGERDRAVAAVVEQLQALAEFRAPDVEFLLDIGDPAEAAAHVVRLRERIEEGQWQWLLPLAKRLKAADQKLGATVLYRALLDDLLNRGQTKAYPHGVRYLGLLAAMNAKIPDWNGVPSHAGYLAGLRQRHGLKRSFWRRVDP